MNRKGFTLVELLLTLIILGIISVISYVSITSVIEDSKNKNCLSLKKNIESAVKNYVSDNRYSNSINVDISLSELVDGGYLSSSIKDPYDNSKDLNIDSITVKIVLNDDKTYQSATINGISCENRNN